MQSKVLNESAELTIAVVFDSGEEVAEGLQKLAGELNLTAARFTGIGALSRAILGFFDPEKREYREIKIDEQVEVLSMIGNFAMEDSQKKVHAHMVVGKSDGTAHGGHLLQAWVRPTLELLIIESPNFLARKMNSSIGLPLIDLSEGWV